MEGKEKESKFANCSNLELWDIVHSEPGDYPDDTRALAQLEWDRRVIPEEDLAIIRAREARAAKPLPWVLRILFALMGVGLLPIMIAAIAATAFESSGRKRWASDAWRSLGIGFLCFVGLALLFLASRYGWL